MGGVFECGGETRVGVCEFSTVLEVIDEVTYDSAAISGMIAGCESDGPETVCDDSTDWGGRWIMDC